MRAAVIGGGITGLSTAYYLLKKLGVQVDIYERESEIGGLAGAFDYNGTLIDKYYHFIYTHDEIYYDLLKELDLDKDIIWGKSKTSYYSDGRIYPFTTPVDLLNFKPLSFMSRIRFGFSLILASKYDNIEKLENQTTEEFIIKFFGRQGWEKIWGPMLKIKFGDNYNKIPAVWIWERIASRFKSRKGGGEGEVFGYLKGSFHRVNQKLLEAILEKGGGKLYLNTDVSEIKIENGSCKGVVADGKLIPYDLVICTTALPIFVNLCKNAPKDYIEPLKKVKYDSVLLALLVLDKSLSDTYWLNISDNSFPFGGVIEHTNLVPSDMYGGKSVVYLSKYLNPSSSYLKMTEEEVIKEFSQYLKKIFPDFDEKNVLKGHVFKNGFGQPIWPMKYSTFKPGYITPVKGLFLADTAQIYPNDRGMNFCLKLAMEAADAVAGEINR